jgi:hypothetical protein
VFCRQLEDKVASDRTTDYNRRAFNADPVAKSPDKRRKFIRCLKQRRLLMAMISRDQENRGKAVLHRRQRRRIVAIVDNPVLPSVWQEM